MSTKKLILIIEDDREISDTIRDILIDEGYRVEIASNGQAALDHLGGTLPLPDVMLLDIMMPIMNGYDFRTIQLADPRLRDIPIIALSADGRIQEKSERLKVEHFVRKPVELDVLLELVAQAVA